MKEVRFTSTVVARGKRATTHRDRFGRVLGWAYAVHDRSFIEIQPGERSWYYTGPRTRFAVNVYTTRDGVAYGASHPDCGHTDSLEEAVRIADETIERRAKAKKFELEPETTRLPGGRIV